jgi:hypothetical protein
MAGDSRFDNAFDDAKEIYIVSLLLILSNKVNFMHRTRTFLSILQEIYNS